MEKILIVEDDRLIAELERDYLEAAGYAVETEASGKEGLRMALSGDYDLVLLDVMLPEMSGFEVCRRLRLLGKKREEVLAARDLKIMPLSRRVFLKAREISLTKREYDVLLFLASHPDRVFSREQLFERVWGEDALGDTATVTVHVNRLREKIEADPSRPEYIETVWGVGYRFMGH